MAWIIISIIVLLLLILLRKFIKRLIFIFVLLVIAFFMYGLFNPSGANTIWEQIKSFPQWVASFLGGEYTIPSMQSTQPTQLISTEKGIKRVPVGASGSATLSFIREKFPPQEIPLPPQEIILPPVSTPSSTGLIEEKAEDTLATIEEEEEEKKGLTSQEIRETEELFRLLLG
jgi:hypothetical protein